MCDRKNRNGSQCQKASDFFVLVRVEPQTLVMPDGARDMERFPAGRSVNVCAVHLVQSVRELHALPIRCPGEAVKVRPLRAQ